MIVLTSNDESTYKPQSSLYRLLPHYGITLPLARAIICHCLAQNDTSGAFFIKAPLSFLLFTLHQSGWNPDKHWGCERWRVTHHSSPLFTFGLHTKLNGKSTCSVFEEGPTDLAFPSAADFQFTYFHRFSGWRVGEEWWRVERTSSPVQIP